MRSVIPFGVPGRLSCMRETTVSQRSAASNRREPHRRRPVDRGHRIASDVCIRDARSRIGEERCWPYRDQEKDGVGDRVGWSMTSIRTRTGSFTSSTSGIAAIDRSSSPPKWLTRAGACSMIGISGKRSTTASLYRGRSSGSTVARSDPALEARRDAEGLSQSRTMTWPEFTEPTCGSMIFKSMSWTPPRAATSLSHIEVSYAFLLQLGSRAGWEQSSVITQSIPLPYTLTL